MKWWSEFYTDNKERKCWVSWLGDMLFRSFRFKPFIKNFRVHLEHSFPLGHNGPMWNKTSLYTLVYYRWHKFICSPSLHQVCNVYKYCTLNWSCRDKLLLSVDNLLISIDRNTRTVRRDSKNNKIESSTSCTLIFKYQISNELRHL